jgi:amidase
LADLIAFDDAHKDLEEPSGFEDQSILIESQATSGFTDEYKKALVHNHDLGRTRGIDAALKAHNLDALVLPARGWTTTPAALAGYPIVTVPLGFYPDGIAVEPAGPKTVWPAPGAPFGLSFLGTAWSEAKLVGYAYAYEQKTKTRLQRRAYPAAIPLTQLKDVIEN